MRSRSLRPALVILVTLLRTSSLVRADGTGRSIFGRVVPYNEVAEVDDGFGPYREKFAPGAFARSIAERGSKVRLFTVHNASRKLPIGKATELREAADGLHASFTVAEVRDGDEALELVRSGVVDAFSVGFRPIRDGREKGVTVRLEAALMEVSLVGVPAYAGATVAGVRSATPVLSVDIARRRLDLLLEAW